MEEQMAPRTLARSRAFDSSSWLHPRWYGPEVCYADGGDDDAGAGAVDAVVAEDTDSGGADDWTPPSRDEYEQLVASKRKADGEAAARRKYLKAHGIDPKTGEKLQADEPDDAEPAAKEPQQQGASPAEIRRQIEKAAAEAELKGRRQTRALVTGVNASLAEAGWNGQRLNSLMKLIDLDEVEVETDGEISGLSEQIESIKAEWPEFFKRTRTPAGSAKPDGVPGQNGVGGAKVDTADKPAPKPEPKGWAEQIAAKALRS